MRIFISYAREDGKQLALRLRDDLQAGGYQPWLDLSEIAGGGVWTQNIEEAIETSDLMLALLSVKSYQSEYCRAEQLRAIRKGKRLIPVLVQPDADRPIHLEHLNYLDFSDPARYDERLRDLLSDLSAGQAFRPPVGPIGSDGRPLTKAFKDRHLARKSPGEKRDTAAFRRYLADLRKSDWLGSRYWWTYFLFTMQEMSAVIATLEADALLSPAKATGQSTSRWDDTVRLYFRPRTPEQWGSEGIRPLEQRRHPHITLPVYLLFDLEAVICQQEVRFSAADPVVSRKTYAVASAFGELPFEMIYHDSVVRSDERDEIMQSRKAQVLIPHQLGLETLQYIWCRSAAEYETLRTLLPDALWQQWRDKITVRADHALFHRRWTYVDEVMLTGTGARFRFNPASADTDRRFEARLELTPTSPAGQPLLWREEMFTADGDFALEFGLSEPLEQYELRLYLDDALAYAGRYQADDGVL